MDDLKLLYRTTGVKGKGVAFLFTVYIDLLKKLFLKYFINN